MFTINIDKECGCFKKSDFKNNKGFENKDDALDVVVVVTVVKSI